MEKKNIRVVEFPLIVDKAAADNLNKRFEVGRLLYNEMNGFYQKRLRELTLSKEWTKLNKEIRREYQLLETQNEGAKKQKKTTPTLKVLYDKRNAMIREMGFSEYDFVGNFIKHGHKFSKSLGSNVVSMMSSQLWIAYEKYFFSSCEVISFKKKDEFNSLASNNKSAIRFLYDEDGGFYYVLLSNRMAKAKPLRLRVLIPSDDYRSFMLRQVEKNGIRVTRVLRRKEKTKWHYYVQVTISCDDVYARLDDNGELYHTYATGERVSLNLYNDRLVAFSEKNGFKQWNLTEGYAEHQAVVTELSQQIDALRRKLNPDNFDEEGKIKPGIIKDGKRQKLRWVTNLEYRQLKNQLREEHRKFTVTKKLRLRQLCYEILALGCDVTVYDCNIEYRHTKPDYAEMIASGEGLPSQKEMRKKAKSRKSVQQGAPGTLLALLDNKLLELGYVEIKKVRVPEEIFFYSLAHDKDNSKAFEGGNITAAGKTFSNLAYRAALLYYYKDGVIDKVALRNTLSSSACYLHLSDL